MNRFLGFRSQVLGVRGYLFLLSSPQSSLYRSVLIKLSPSNRIIFTTKGALRTIIECFLSTDLI